MPDNAFLRFLIAAPLLLAIASCNSPPLTAEAFDWQSYDNPPMDTRPLVRWWWPGADVDPAELARELDVLAAQGFGGAEIQAFNAALEPVEGEALSKRLDYDSPRFWTLVQGVASAAQASSLRIDLNLGTGWSTGGPHIDVADSMQTLLWGEAVVNGPATVDLPLTGPEQTPFYMLAEIAADIGEPLARDLTSTAKLVAVIAGKETGGRRDRDNDYNLQDTVQLDPKTLVELTSFVEDGKLHWDAPDGKWRVVSLWQAPDGQYISLPAYDQPSFVVDHLNQRRVLDNLNHLLRDETGLTPYFADPIKGIFIDSFEMVTERHYTDDFFAKFQELRGYDIKPYLPFVMNPGADNHLFDGAGIKTRSPFSLSETSDQVPFVSERLHHDYSLTVSDLFIERFFETTEEWAAARGLGSRMQPYGVRIDVMRAAGSVSIPEAEQLYAGGSELFLKVISSGAHQYGRSIASAESLVWAGKDHMTTPRKLKAAVDKLFTAGINQVVFHGFPYKTNNPAYGLSDWHPFSSPFGGGTYSTNVSETDPFWDYFVEINAYIARCQYLLRQGMPTADIAVFYPWLGVPASLARADELDEFLFGGQFEDEPLTGRQDLFELVDAFFGGKYLGPVVDGLTGLWPVLQELEAAGYTWEWINDERLVNCSLDKDQFVSGNARFKALLVPDQVAMSKDAAQVVKQMAESGVSIVFLGEYPTRQPGFHDAELNDQAVRAAIEGAIGTKNVQNSDNALESMQKLGVLPTVGVAISDHVGPSNPVKTISRRLDSESFITFARNQSAKDVEVVLSPHQPCPEALWLDPWTGGVQEPVSASGRFAVKLAPYGSGFLACNLPKPNPELVTKSPVGDQQEFIDISKDPSWSLTVDGVEVATGESALGDWRDWEGLSGSFGPGLYKVTVELPEVGDKSQLFLDLGQVHGVALVSVDGQKAGTAIVPPYRVSLPQGGKTAEIDITVVIADRNGLIAAAEALDKTAAQFNEKSDTRVAAGLVGPVLLVKTTGLEEN